jgi:hypothetical protein
VANLLKARTAEPEETSIARTQHGNNVFYAVRTAFSQPPVCMQQTNCLKRRFLCGTRQIHNEPIVRAGVKTVSDKTDIQRGQIEWTQWFGEK